MKIENLEIGIKNRPTIIAEMSGNHNQSLKKRYYCGISKDWCTVIKILKPILLIQ